MASLLLDLTVLLIIGVLLLLLWFTHIKPELFPTVIGGRREAPSSRGRSKLFDPTLPGVVAEILYEEPSRPGFKNITVRNTRGQTTREYANGEVVLLDETQARVDIEGPFFMALRAKYARSEYEKDVKEIMNKQREALRQADHWKREHRHLMHTFNHQLQKAIEARMRQIEEQRR